MMSEFYFGLGWFWTRNQNARQRWGIEVEPSRINDGIKGKSLYFNLGYLILWFELFDSESWNIAEGTMSFGGPGVSSDSREAN
jgi:hypothetical protein